MGRELRGNCSRKDCATWLLLKVYTKFIVRIVSKGETRIVQSMCVYGFNCPETTAVIDQRIIFFLKVEEVLVV